MSDAPHPLMQLRKSYAHLRPILVLAPTQRCGSTLLQRALNVGGESILFGENFLFVEHFPELVGGPMGHYRTKVSITESILESFRNGNTGIDATALFPDYRQYVQALLRGFYGLADFYDSYARTLGFRHWGLKHQIRACDGLHNFLVLLPRARPVCLYRDLMDVARSYRARWPQRLETAQQRIAFGERWAKNLTYLMSIRRDKLLIRYEDMVADPDTHVAQISDFLGITVSRAVFEVRINIPATKDDLASKARGGGYIRPAEISKKDKSDLLLRAGEVYEKVGYRPLSA